MRTEIEERAAAESRPAQAPTQKGGDVEARRDESLDFWCWQRRWGVPVVLAFAAVFAAGLAGWVVFR